MMDIITGRASGSSNPGEPRERGAERGSYAAAGKPQPLPSLFEIRKRGGDNFDDLNLPGNIGVAVDEQGPEGFGALGLMKESSQENFIA